MSSGRVKIKWENISTKISHNALFWVPLVSMMGPILHKAIVWRGNPSFITSLPGTHRVQEFLLTQGVLHIPWRTVATITYMHSLGLYWSFWINIWNWIFRNQHWSASSIDPTCPVMHQRRNLWLIECVLLMLCIPPTHETHMAGLSGPFLVILDQF